MKIDSAVELKKLHAREILDILKQNGVTTKKRITEITGLSFATVSNICNEMRGKNYIEEKAVDDEKVVGRTPKNIALKSESLLSLCFDLTKTGNIQVAVIDYVSEILFEQGITYGKDAGVSQLVELCTEFYKTTVLGKYSEEQILGVGIAVPGIFEKKTRNIVSSEIEMFNNQPLKEMFAAALKKPVYIDNDSNLCVMAKYVEEKDKCLQEDVVYIFADEGLGIGVVSNGALVRGGEGYAPEICHIPIGNCALTCHLCSNPGCVESDLRMAGYAEKYNLYSNQRIEDYQTFRSLWEQGEETAGKVWDENIEIWGKLISIINNMFNPGQIYIGGETLSVLKKGILQITKHVESRQLAAQNLGGLIQLDENCCDTILKGAAQMLFSQWVPEV